MLVFFCFVVFPIQLIATEFQRHVLITGGAGFVGRHFTHRLCTKGWLVTVVDSLVSESALHPSRWPLHLQCTDGQQLIFIKQDCREFFKSTKSHIKWDLFIHLAAVVGGRMNIEGSPLLVADDLSIDSAAFQWAVDNSTKPTLSKMVYFSSSAVYPLQYQRAVGGTLLKENMVDLVDVRTDFGHSDSSYGWAKLTGEYLAHVARQTYGLNVSVYRPFSGYGEDQNEAYPFIAILKKIMARANPIQIWSNSVRDFVYIEDIVTCVLDIESMDDNNNNFNNNNHSSNSHTVLNGMPLNLATGIGTSFNDLVKLMASHYSSYDPDIVVVDDMPQGVHYRVGDVTLSNSYGCQSTTSLKEGIEKAIEYLSQQTKNSQTIPSSSSSSSNVIHKDDNHYNDNDDQEREPVYSSFHCIGGSQTFSNWTSLFDKYYIHSIHEWSRICRFEGSLFTTPKYTLQNTL